MDEVNGPGRQILKYRGPRRAGETLKMGPGLVGPGKKQSNCRGLRRAGLGRAGKYANRMYLASWASPYVWFNCLCFRNATDFSLTLGVGRLKYGRT